jgi:hypothetical protein
VKTFVSIDTFAAIPHDGDLPFFQRMVFVLTLLAIGVWLMFRRPTRGFLPDFAKLLDRPEFVDESGPGPITRSFLKGDFRGRKVVILLQTRRGVGKLVVSMETHSRATMESHDFTGYRSDREGELALWALEVDHKFGLRHSDGCLKGVWGGGSFFGFGGRFDPAKMQAVLEAMHTLAGSLERRAA